MSITNGITINGITFKEDGYEWSTTPPEGKQYGVVYVWATPEKENEELKKQMAQMKKQMEILENRLKMMEENEKQRNYYRCLPNSNDQYAEWIAEYIDAPEGRPKPTKENVSFTDAEREIMEDHMDEQEEYWREHEQEEWIREHASEWRWDAIAEKYRNTCDLLEDDE